MHAHQYLPYTVAFCKAMQELPYTMYHASMHVQSAHVDDVLLLRS